MTSAKLEFKCLPSYARFLLDHKLHEYVIKQLQLSREAEIPVLKYFDWMTEVQLLELGTSSAKELLEAFEKNKVNELIYRSVNSWVNNQLPNLDQDQIVAEDITSLSLIRRKTLRFFLPAYSTDINTCLQLMDEIDQFTTEQEIQSFNTFIALQNQKIHTINETLQAQHAELAEAQAIAMMGSFEWNMETGNNRLSPSLVNIFELETRSNLSLFLNSVHIDDREKVAAAIERSLQSPDGIYECEYRYQKNGPEKVLWSRGIVTFRDSKPISMKGTVMDVTDYHTVISRLQESEALYKQAQSLTHIGNWAWNIKENTVSWSDEMYRIYGLEPQSQEITLEKFAAFVHPQDRERRLGEIAEALRTHHSPEYHIRIINPDGAVKTLRGRGEILVDKSGAPYRMVGTCQDITTEFHLNQEIKKREENLVELNHYLEQTNAELKKKNYELESFNYAISHDLQEPLRKIQVFSSLLEESAGEKKEALRDAVISKINLSAARLQKLISDLFSFSFLIPSDQQKNETTSLDKVLQEVLNDYQLVIEEKKAIIRVGPLPALPASATLLYQLFQNLVSNAIKYAREDIPPELAITSIEVPGSEIKDVQGIYAGSMYYKISVEDNGIGLDEKYTDRIFNLFQRLHDKKSYTGTGIGLSMCKKIMDYYNGFITVKSEPGKGASFSIYFPISRDA